ncbi:Uncharacterised protein [Vibrio cholerae]|nr:Uncharacterised protein [Vibrio cholerae]
MFSRHNHTFDCTGNCVVDQGINHIGLFCNRLGG